MDIGMDTGDILCQRETPIQDSDNAETLSDRLAKIGGDLLMETLPIYLEGKITPTPQNQDAATYAPLLRKEDGELNFSHGAIELERRIRAFTPWPERI
jgi:methionyl-tRNA formyltransferase